MELEIKFAKMGGIMLIHSKLIKCLLQLPNSYIQNCMPLYVWVQGEYEQDSLIGEECLSYDWEIYTPDGDKLCIDLTLFDGEESIEENFEFLNCNDLKNNKALEILQTITSKTPQIQHLLVSAIASGHLKF